MLSNLWGWGGVRWMESKSCCLEQLPKYSQQGVLACVTEDRLHLSIFPVLQTLDSTLALSKLVLALWILFKKTQPFVRLDVFMYFNKKILFCNKTYFK